jgi:hypothetical protein
VTPQYVSLIKSDFFKQSDYLEKLTSKIGDIEDLKEVVASLANVYEVERKPIYSIESFTHTLDLLRGKSSKIPHVIDLLKE